MANKLDLSELLPEEDREKIRWQEKQKKAEKDLREKRQSTSIPENKDQPEALILFWEEFHCSNCGENFEAPGYHPSPIMIRILEKDGGENGNSTYRYETPRRDHPSNLPLHKKISHHEITYCSHCAGEEQVISTDEQLDLFGKGKEEKKAAPAELSATSRHSGGGNSNIIPNNIPLEEAGKETNDD